LKTRRLSETSSSIWESGWPGPCRRRKRTPRQSGNTPLPISSSKHTLILSMATPNTHGMNTSNHNASKLEVYMKGLSKFCKKYPFGRRTDQKVSRFLIRTDVAMYPRRGHRCRTPHFVAKISLTYKTEFLIVRP
jgi:hypothetical protein